MFVSKTAISDGAASKLPTLSTYLNAVLIETVAIDTKDGSPRTRPIRILTGDEMALACHRDIIVDFRDGAPELVVRISPSSNFRIRTRRRQARRFLT